MKPSEFFSASVAPSDVRISSTGVSSIRGLASAFNSYINAEWPTIIEPDAWTEALNRYGNSVLLLWGHQDELPPLGLAKVWQSSIVWNTKQLWPRLHVL